MPCARIVGEIHDIEACPDVGVEHPLIGSRVVVVVMGREILGISHHGFQVAKGDVYVFEQMLGGGEGGIGIGATHERIAHQHHIDGTHNEPHSLGLCMDCCFERKHYAVTGDDVNLTANEACSNRSSCSTALLRSRRSNRSNCFEAEEFSGYVEGFNISRHALPVNLIEKSLGFEHADVVKIPEFHGIALLFQLWIHEFRDPIGVM